MSDLSRVEEVRQREAMREQERAASPQAVERYLGSSRWTIPRRQFQALYVAVGSFDEAVALQPELAPFPPQENMEPFDSPPPYILYSWIKKIDSAIEEVDPKLLSIMEKKIEANFRAGLRRTVAESGMTVRELARLARAGELDASKQVQLLYAANAANYGMGNYGQYIKNTAPQGPQQTFQIGRLNINAGQAPSRRMKAGKKARRITAPILEGEFREVADVGSDST